MKCGKKVLPHQGETPLADISLGMVFAGVKLTLVRDTDFTGDSLTSLKKGSMGNNRPFLTFFLSISSFIMVMRRFRYPLPKNYLVTFKDKRSHLQQIDKGESRGRGIQSCSKPAVELSEGQRPKNNKNQNTLEQISKKLTLFLQLIFWSLLIATASIFNANCQKASWFVCF